MGGHQIGGHQAGAVDPEGPGVARAAGGEHARDRGQGQLVDRVGHDPAQLGLVGAGQAELPPGHRLLVGGRVGLVGAHQPGFGPVVVVGPVGTGPPERLRHQVGLGLDVQAGERHLHVAAEPAHLVHGHLEGRGRGLAGHRGDAHPVAAGLLQADRVEAGGDVGSQVGRAVDLVEELGGDCAHAHLAAGAVVFAYHRRAVGGDLGPGEPDPGHAVHLGEEGVVAPGGLGAALDDVAGRGGPGQLVPGVAGPAVMPGRRPDRHRGVGDPAGDHDVGPPVQGLHDPPAAQVGVGGYEAAGVADRLAAAVMAEMTARGQLGQSAHEVVAVHAGDHRGQAQPLGHVRHRLGAAPGVEPARVGHHLDPGVQAGPHDLLHLGHEGAGVAAPRSLGPGAGQDQHGQLGQPVAGEEVDGPALHHLRRGRQPVAVEARAVGHPNRLSHRRPRRCLDPVGCRSRRRFDPVGCRSWRHLRLSRRGLLCHRG